MTHSALTLARHSHWLGASAPMNSTKHLFETRRQALRKRTGSACGPAQPDNHLYISMAPRIHSGPLRAHRVEAAGVGNGAASLLKRRGMLHEVAGGSQQFKRRARYRVQRVAAARRNSLFTASDFPVYTRPWPATPPTAVECLTFAELQRPLGFQVEVQWGIGTPRDLHCGIDWQTWSIPSFYAQHIPTPRINQSVRCAIFYPCGLVQGSRTWCTSCVSALFRRVSRSTSVVIKRVKGRSFVWIDRWFSHASDLCNRSRRHAAVDLSK